MLLAGVGSALTGAPLIAAIFYVLAILCLVLVFYRADFFSSSPKAAYSVTVLAVIVLTCVWFVVRPMSVQELARAIVKEMPSRSPESLPTATPDPLVEQFAQMSHPPIPANESDIHKRYRTDCPDHHPLWNSYDLVGKEFKGTYQIEVLMCFGGEVRAVALYAYLPSDKRTIPAIYRMSDDYGNILRKMAGPDLLEYPPKRNPDRFKVTFAGRIFIYTEDDMSDEEAVALSKMFSGKGAAMTIAPHPDSSGAYHLR